ncbi:hypothetical protein ACM66B_000924 [Microbotryomycetes sp. NB124-2]
MVPNGQHVQSSTKSLDGAANEQPDVKQLTEAQQAKADRIRAQKQAKASEIAAKKAERKAKKLEAQASGAPQEQGPPDNFLKREWVHVPNSSSSSKQGTTVSILTWNMLAQALVRRDLFPGSDFLKVKDRVPQLMKEVLYYSPDIACLQEVDRLRDHLPALGQTHDHTSFIGYPNKAHGLLIAHKKDIFERVGQRGIRLDELPIRDVADLVYHDVNTDSPEEGVNKATARLPLAGELNSRQSMRKAVGLSRSTRNVGLFVALKFKNRSGGVIVGTTHLFWHPKHVYERVRQSALLLREARRFKNEGNEGAWRDWPLFLAGDFNAQPEEASYVLLKGVELSEEQRTDLSKSTVVHQSVDKLYEADVTTAEIGQEGEEGEEGAQEGTQGQSGEEEDEDKVIKNCRLPTDDDGLASLTELTSLFGIKNQEHARAVSAYGQIGALIESEAGKQYGDRDSGVYSGESGGPRTTNKKDDKTDLDMDARISRGDFEPMWSNFTPLWRLSIDYIFLVPGEEAEDARPEFTSLLSTHSTETLGKGLPRMGISASDHVAIAARVVIPGVADVAE